MRKKYRSKKAWDEKSWNQSGSQQKVWHYLWFLLTFGKNSLIHYGRWIQQEGLVFNHQNTSATPFWPSRFHPAKNVGKQALQIRVKLWSCRFVGMLPYWDFCFKNFSARSDFSLLALCIFRRCLWPWSSPGSLIFLVHGCGCGCGWLWPWCFPD